MLILLLNPYLVYTDLMNHENESPSSHRDRFEIPQHLVDDINAIGAKVLAEEVFVGSLTIEIPITEQESKSEEKAKIVKLLNSLLEPSTGDSSADRTKAEFIIAQLNSMRCPVDGFYNMLGQNIDPAIVADKMLEERDESGY